MAKLMKIIAVLAVALTGVMAALYLYFHMDVFETLAITFGTISYHFVMRLVVGGIYSITMRNRADYTKRWYRNTVWETRLYQVLKVKKWKNKMPTYNASYFDPNLHTWDEIAQAMCQAELVHETIMVLSFLPIVATVWYGALPVFITTSVVAALFDAVFVMMQRYNRARIVKLAMKTH